MVLHTFRGSTILKGIFCGASVAFLRGPGVVPSAPSLGGEAHAEALREALLALLRPQPTPDAKLGLGVWSIIDYQDYFFGRFLLESPV